MLKLSVRSGDCITIGPDIVIKFDKMGRSCSVAIDAPKDLRISRAKRPEREDASSEAVDQLQNSEASPSPNDFKRKAPPSV